MPALKKKTRDKSKKAEEDGEVSLDLGASFDAAEAKSEDFDLDLSNAKWSGRKGQAGTRRRPD